MNKSFLFLSLILLALAGCDSHGNSINPFHTSHNTLASHSDNTLPPPPHIQNNQYTGVSISSTNGGDVDPGTGIVSAVIGDEMILQAIPLQGFLFDHWNSNVSLLNSDSDALNGIIVEDGAEVEAVFVQVVAN